jgi:hypothetical protein
MRTRWQSVARKPLEFHATMWFVGRLKLPPRVQSLILASSTAKLDLARGVVTVCNPARGDRVVPLAQIIEPKGFKTRLRLALFRAIKRHASSELSVTFLC